MSTNPKNLTIVAINRGTGEAYKMVDNKFAPYSLSKANSAKEFFVTYIPSKDVMATTVEVSKSTPADDIDDVVILKTYESLELDTDGDYKIVYSQSPIDDGENITFNVFAVDGVTNENSSANIIEKTDYIDYMTTLPFMCQSLYTRGMIAPDGSDVFLYLMKDDAFCVAYQNGEYLTHVNIKQNLRQIYDSFSDQTGDRMAEGEFFRMLQNDGMKANVEILGNIFEELMENTVKPFVDKTNRIYKADVKNLYFGSDIGHIKGVEYYFENVKYDFKPFDFNIAINSKDFPKLTQMDVLMMLTGQAYAQEQDDEYNFSTFLRPPPFSKRPSGKLMYALLAGLIVGIAYPAYQYIHGYLMDSEGTEKDAEYQVKNNDLNRIKQRLQEIAGLAKIEQDNISAQETALNNKTGLLDGMYDKKVKYQMKGETVYDITNLINDQDGKLTRVRQSKDGTGTFTIRMKTDKRMTELYKTISNTNKYSVTSNAIVDDGGSPDIYESNVSIMAITQQDTQQAPAQEAAASEGGNK